MDRNSIIGLSLIAVLFLVYFYWVLPATTPANTPATQQQVPSVADSAAASTQPLSDSARIQALGSLGAAATGEEKLTTIANDKLSIVFSNNGSVQSVELKDFKTYKQDPLVLHQPSHNSFKLIGRLDGKPLDIHALRYAERTSKNGDSTVLIYEAQPGENTLIRHTYSIPASGYQIAYKLETSGIKWEGEQFDFTWNNNIPLIEKSMDDTRARTTVNYFTVADGFDGLSESSVDLDEDDVAQPVKWASIRQKFFVSAIISNTAFSSGKFSTIANPTDPKFVKNATVELKIPVADVTAGKANFRYYFGPNDYELIGDVAESFSRNVYLGWPPVIWVNKFLIIPMFNLLKSFIGNYGVIIIVIVLLVKLLLTPLSYKSYLGMAKMRLLKPELDLIKEKNGDNMAQAQQDQMKLYAQAGVSPFSGCIPLLLQLPIILSMFYFFPVTIEFRQEAFLWAEDLSAYDSVLDLPFSIPFYGSHVSLFVLLMTASTIVSTWQNNQLTNVTGPMKSMSYIMPVIFLFLLNNFSAALSFYYLVSNVLGFAQQLIIRRFVDEDKIKAVMDDHRKKMASGTGKKSKFMTMLEDARKASEEARKKSSRK